jgi:pimeloyl-ACP methyl ester carboxylesterase
MTDDDLQRFLTQGAEPAAAPTKQAFVEHDGARIWYARYGSGTPVILLHGGLGHGGNWAYQVPALLEHGFKAVLIDSRGHGRSTRDDRSYSYELLGSDVLAVMDALRIDRAALVGWSDGATTALMLARNAPERVAGVFYFACNMHPSGAKPFQLTPVVERCFARHKADYARLSATPVQFDRFVEDVGLMQRTQPTWTDDDLLEINVPVVVVQAEHDEFITPEHAEWLARGIPNARLVVLPGVTHFAPLQRPELFNSTLLAFLESETQK